MYQLLTNFFERMLVYAQVLDTLPAPSDRKFPSLLLIYIF